MASFFRRAASPTRSSIVSIQSQPSVSIIPEEKKSDEKKKEVVEGPPVDTTPLLTKDVLAALWEQQRLTDVTFVIGDKKLVAHRVVLGAASPVFEGMLFSRKGDGSPEPALPKGPITVKIKDTDPETFAAMLRCIYTDEVEIDATNIHMLIKAASKYHVEKLRTACAGYMERDVNKDNVLELFQIAPYMLGDEEFGMKYIEENTEDVMKSDGILRLSKERLAVILKSDKLNISEIALFKHVQRWVEHQISHGREEKDPQELAKDLVKHIRFPLMELSDMAQVVSTSGLLDNGTLVTLFSYISVGDEKVRESMDTGFNSTPRAGEGTQGGGNWTWDVKKKGRNVTLASDNLTANHTGYSWNNGVLMGSKEFKTGSHYWEVKIDYNNNDMIGVAMPDMPFDGTTSAYSTYAHKCWMCHLSSGTYGGTIGTKTHLDLQTRTGDIIGISLIFNKKDMNFDMTVYKNKRLIGMPFRGIPPPVVASFEFYATPAKITLDPKAARPTT